MPISDEQMNQLRCVKTAHERDLMGKANVVGVGIGFRRRHGKTTEQPTIIVSVTHKVPRSALAPEDVVPSEVEGIPVDVQEVGELRALDHS